MSRVYQEAGDAFRQVMLGKKGLKDIIYSSQAKNKRKLYALVCETLKYRPVLEELIFTCGLQKHLEAAEAKGKKKIGQRGKKRKRNDAASSSVTTNTNQNDPATMKVDPAIFFVMLYEHIFGSGIKGGGTLKRLIRAFDDSLKQALENKMKKMHITENEGLLPPEVRLIVTLPRYIRANLLKCSLQEASEELGATISGIEKNDIKQDDVVYDLLVLPGKVNEQVAIHPWVESGSLVLQDKSSCLPATAAYALIQSMMKSDTCTSFNIVDCCAAPGNKTTHLASLLSQLTRFNGRILACEKDSKRCQLLRSRVSNANAANVDILNMDFFRIDCSNPDFNKAKIVLVDPSCSGSGMVHRLDFALDKINGAGKTQSRIFHKKSYGNTVRDHKLPTVEENDEPTSLEAIDTERVKQLSDFQKRILSHALSFPNVEYVLYSTCSLHKEENEDVIASVLEELSTADRSVEVVDVLPHWPRRGIEHPTLSKSETGKMVRVNPYEDNASGFFLALLHVKRKL